jgi:catechol 2,3-dioxygenase-like lactoylglutathione lyase family enzyme
VVFDSGSSSAIFGSCDDPGVIVGIDHVQVAAPPGCEEAARAWYGGLLGLTELPKPPALAARGGVWFACGEQQLHVGGSEGFVAAAKAHPALRVSSVAVLERLAERLAPVEWDDSVVGVRRFYASDPWGNRVELLA